MPVNSRSLLTGAQMSRLLAGAARVGAQMSRLLTGAASGAQMPRLLSGAANGAQMSHKNQELQAARTFKNGFFLQTHPRTTRPLLTLWK